MANFIHKIAQSYVTDAGTVTSVTSTYTDDTEEGIDATVNATTTNKEFDIAVTLANIQSMVLTCDKAVTIKTNSTSTPQETITLTAGQAIIWAHDHSEDAPFAGNLTKFYVTNAGSAAARFRFSALLHQGV